MSFIKLAFWLCVIIMIVPIGPEKSAETSATPVSQTETPPLSLQAMGAAHATVSDMASFCDRNPQVCATGALALEHFKTKAVFVAGYVYDMVAGGDRTPAGEIPKAKTQPVTAPLEAPPGAPFGTPVGTTAGQMQKNTLLPTDLETPWHGPAEGDA